MSMAVEKIRVPAMRESTASAHRQAVARAIALMHREIAEPITIEELAETACMSRFHFTRAFCAVTGVPPVQFLWALRLQKAKRLLSETDLSVTDIGFEVGYQSSGTFNGRFHSQVGVTPQAFRRGFAQFGATTLGALRPLVQPGTAPGRRVVLPAGFEGLAVAAAFQSRFPAGRPFSCMLSALPAPSVAWQLPDDGAFHLLLAAMPWDATLGEVLVEEGCLVARCGNEDGQPGLSPVSFREQCVFDPPLLTAVPLLLAKDLLEQTDGARPTLWPAPRADAPIAARAVH